MPGTAVIDLGFNVEELTPQQKRVVQLLTEVYDLTKKLDGIKVSPIDISGFGQLNKVVAEQNAILTQANKVSTDYARSIKAAADAEAAQAKARKANSDAQRAETQSENEVIKQINLEIEAEKKLAAAKNAKPANIPVTINPTKTNADEIQLPTNELTDFQKAEAEAANAAYALSGAQNQIERSAKQASTQIVEVSESTKAYSTALREAIAAQLENEAELVANKAAQKELSAGNELEKQKLIELREQEIALTQEKRELSAITKNLSLSFVSEEGSIEKLRADVALLTQQYEALGAAEKQSAFGQKIKNELNTLQPALVQAEAAIGKNQRKVGDYTNSITKAFTGAFSQLRTLAYIIPGLGIAGIFSLIFDGVSQLAKALFSTVDPFQKNIQAQKDFAEELENTNKLIKEQSDLIKDLTQSDINYFQNQLKFSQASGENTVQQFAITKRLNEETKRQADNTVESLEASYSAQAKLKTQLQSIDEQKKKAVEGIADANKKIAEAESKTISLNGAVQQAIEKAGKISGLKQVKEDLTSSLDALTAQFNAIKSKYEAGQKALQDQSNANAAVEAQALAELKFNNDERRKLILAENQIEVGLIEDRNNRILSNEKSTLQQRLAALQSNAAAAKRLSLAEAANVINNPSSSNADIVIARKKANAEILKINREEAEKENKLREDYRLKDIDAISDIYKQEIQLSADKNKKLADDEKKAYNIRASALIDFITKQQELENEEFKNRLAHAGATPEELAIASAGGKVQIKNKNITDKQLEDLEQTHQNKLIQINTSGADALKQIAEKARLEQIQIAKDLQSEIEDIYAKGIAGTAEKIDTETTKLQNKLFDSFKAGSISRNQLEKGLRDTALAGQKKQLQAALDSYKQQLSGLNPVSEKYTEIENKIANIEKEINGIDLTGADNKLDDLADKFERFAEIAGNINAAFQAIGDVSFDNQIAALEEAGAQEEKNYEQQQSNIQNSMLSDQERADQLKILDSEHAANQEEIARKQREVDNKKAEFDKEVGIMNIIVNTAAAVIKALPNVPLAISVGILGAAQLAAAVATKVPHYAKGTQDHKGGDAIVAEAGKKELVQFGGQSIVYDKPTYIRNLPRHAKVIPLTESANVMANRALGSGVIVQMQTQHNEASKNDIWEEVKYLGKIIKKSQPRAIKQKRGYTINDVMYLNDNVFHKKAK